MPNQKFKKDSYSNLMGINNKLSQYLTNDNEVVDMTNFDFSTPGSWTKRWGSTMITGTPVSGRISGLYEFEQLNGASKLIATANTNAYYIDSGSFISFRTGLKDAAIFDFVTFVDRLFAFNGTDAFVYNNSTARNFSLPEGDNTNIGFTLSGSASGFSGNIQLAYGYLNEAGFAGPADIGVTCNPAGASYVRLYGLTTPAGYGITALIFYGTSVDGTDLFKIAETPAGATFYDIESYTLGVDPIPTISAFTLIPRYGELYNNQLFVSGFSSLLSTVYFSELAQPEGFKAESFFEVRTNDGDKISGKKSYLGQLLIFKQRSFHALSGDNSTNFLLREISDQYGCLSNRAIVVWEDMCWFLDRKGIAEYNGANVRIISDRVEDIFTNMNIDAAKENAVGVHFKERNEVWFSIPCNGATMNNCTVVYDYVAKGWTKYEGFECSSLTIAKNSLSKQTGMYGGYSGGVSYFHQSVYGDNGQGMTCLVKTKFHHDMGESVTKQFRRLYLNVEPLNGSTAPITVDFYKNYGTSLVYTKDMYFNEYQSRIDFGIPAKSLQMEFSNFSSTLSIQIYGYALEYRFQRNT